MKEAEEREREAGKDRAEEAAVGAAVWEVARRAVPQAIAFARSADIQNRTSAVCPVPRRNARSAGLL